MVMGVVPGLVRVTSTPDPDSLESIATHLLFLSQTFCKGMPSSLLQVVCCPPICMPYTSHLYHDTLAEVLASGVAGTLPIPDFTRKSIGERASSLTECWLCWLPAPDSCVPPYATKNYAVCLVPVLVVGRCWSRRHAERIWRDFFILVRRILRKLPANFSADFDGEF